MASDRGLPDPIRVLAPSGVAALNILGRTIHSALGLPINSNFIELKGMISTGLGWGTLHHHRRKSMLGQIDARLR